MAVSQRSKARQWMALETHSQLLCTTHTLHIRQIGRRASLRFGGIMLLRLRSVEFLELMNGQTVIRSLLRHFHKTRLGERARCDLGRRRASKTKHKNEHMELRASQRATRVSGAIAEHGLVHGEQPCPPLSDATCKRECYEWMQPIVLVGRP